MQREALMSGKPRSIWSFFILTGWLPRDFWISLGDVQNPQKAKGSFFTFVYAKKNIAWVDGHSFYLWFDRWDPGSQLMDSSCFVHTVESTFSKMLTIFMGESQLAA